jgi:hypothetical protein
LKQLEKRGWGIVKVDNLEIERFLQFKSEIRNLKPDNPKERTMVGRDLAVRIVQFEISDFGFKLQESFDFEIVHFHNSPVA